MQQFRKAGDIYEKCAEIKINLKENPLEFYNESIFCYENIYIICLFYYFININILLYKMIQNIILINNSDANVKKIYFRINNYESRF